MSRRRLQRLPALFLPSPPTLLACPTAAPGWPAPRPSARRQVRGGEVLGGVRALGKLPRSCTWPPRRRGRLVLGSAIGVPLESRGPLGVAAPHAPLAHVRVADTPSLSLRIRLRMPRNVPTIFCTARRTARGVKALLAPRKPAFSRNRRLHADRSGDRTSPASGGAGRERAGAARPSGNRTPAGRQSGHHRTRRASPSSCW